MAFHPVFKDQEPGAGGAGWAGAGGTGAPAVDVTGEGAADQYRSIFENAVVGIYQTTVDGRYLRANAALARIYGYQSPSELTSSLTDIARQLYIDPETRSHFAQLMAEHGVVEDFEAQIFRKDGSVIWIKENARCVRDASGAISYFEGTVEDISVRKAAEAKIRQLATVFDGIAEGILIIDPDLTVRAANPAFEAITGHATASLIGKVPALIAPEFHEPGFLAQMLAEAAAQGRWQGEATCLHQRADFFPAWLSLSAVRGPTGAIEHYVLVCTDLTQRKQHEERIRYQANFDSLTGLPNRWLIRDRLDQAIARAQRNDSRVAIAFIDLDRFKQVNDTLGHRAGDQLLTQVARRLRACLRLSDTVGRFGGDEFIVICPDAAERAVGTKIARKILYAFSDPFDVLGQALFVGPSIGIAFFPDDGTSADDLLRNADLAMYNAKVNKPRHFSLYSAEMRRRNDQRLTLENDLQLAIVRHEFVLHYQPCVDLQRGRVVGAESLVRWNHPTLGMISPSVFIGLAEETGLISAIGYWCLRQACTQFRLWRRAGMTLDSVSVNLSPRQFQDPLIVTTVAEILADTGMEPSHLELELTEGAMIGDIDRAVATLENLKGLGVRLAIDDFGTGYSSLAYLKRFPIDSLKIDRSFVRDLEQDNTDVAIVETIIGMARSLGFAVIAEGVETVSQARILVERQCFRFQGYLFSHPLPPDAFEQLLAGGGPQLDLAAYSS